MAVDGPVRVGVRGRCDGLALLRVSCERDERERAHLYRAAVSQADTERRFLRELSERFFAGSAAQLALRALQIEKASDEELEAIRQLIEKKNITR